MIRPFARGDLDALYAISLATGLAGGDASAIYDDPRLIGHIYAAPYALLEPRLALVAEDDGHWTADERRAFMIHHPAPTPREVSVPYPAHLHLNLLPHAQGRGAGLLLLKAWLAEADVTAAHVGVNRDNARAIRFWNRRGFREIPLATRTLWLVRD